MTSGSPAVRERFEEHDPWLTRFWLNGEAFGGKTYDPAADPRIAMFKSRAGPLKGQRVLELGPLEGGHTLQLAGEGASVVAIEGRESNYQRCLFIKELFGLDSVEFVLGDLRAFDLASLGQFDSIFNVGVLYHVEEPWTLLESLGKVSSRMFLATHCIAPDKVHASVEVDRCFLAGDWWIERPVKDRLSGLQNRSFWPTRVSLETMLVLSGWTRVEWLAYEAGHVNGPLASLWTERSADRFR